MAKIEKILEPGKIGNVHLKNRIIYSAMDLRWADGKGHMAHEAIVSLLERARHGVAMVTVPTMNAWQPEGVPYGKSLCLGDDEAIPHLAKIIASIHALDCKAMVSIGARGTRIEGSVTSNTGPSSMRFGYEATIPRELTVAEIEERVEWFGDAAARAAQAGADVVDIHACTGKLVSMFLSPYSNHRTDAYGGDTEGRTKFLRDIIANMRKKAGQDFPLCVRLTVDDLLPGGIDLEEGKRIAAMIAPLVDAMQPSTGTQERIWNITCSYFMPYANMLEATAAIKKVVGGLPVIAMSKLGEPLLAEKALAEGKADFVSLGRPLLCDPHWLEKTVAEDFASIRRCIGCVNCFTFNDRKEIQPPRVSCTVNPELLREESMGAFKPVRKRKKILIVGGGLAGMECARILAGRGHQVSLYEKSGKLGGQWLVAMQGKHKNDQKTLVPWLIRELKKNGVEVYLNQEMTAAELIELQPDEIILATGATPRDLPLPIPANGPKIVQGNDVIMDRVKTGDRVVVVGGRYIGMECAVKLAKAGKHVSVVDAVGIGNGTNPRILGIYRNLMVENGVYLYPDSPVLRIMDYGIDVAHLNSMLSLPADTIVLAIGTKPEQALANELQEKGIPFHLAGDCKRIGDALYAMRDGADLGYAL